MKKVIAIGILMMLCVAAVPYGTDLANVYVRPLDMRDEIYKGLGIPRADFTEKFGGLSERTLIIGNLQIIPQLINDLDGLNKKVVSLETQMAALTKPDTPKEDVAVDPNEVKQ